jgi:metal-responsive CopG/Arc/MetJ family transcriptional regulator
MKKTASTKVSIEVQNELLERLDRIAAEEATTRSDFIVTACERLVALKEAMTSAESDEAYAEAYRRMPEEPAWGNAMLLARMLPKEDW